MENSKARERRWIVLNQDGRHVTLGRHSDPTEDEIVQAAESLRSAGLGGWLAVTEGGYYTRGAVAVLEVRELAPSPIAWAEAVRAFQAFRAQAIEPSQPT